MAFLAACPPKEGVRVFLSFGRDILSNRLYINFEKFEDASEYRKLYSKSEHLKDGDAPLFLQFPQSDRSVVCRVSTRRLEELVLSNLEKYKVTPERLVFDKAMGAMFVDRRKVGYVYVGPERGEHGKFPIHFAVISREAEAIGFPAMALAADFNVHIS